MLNILKDFLLQLVLIATIIFTYQIFYSVRFNKFYPNKLILSLLFGLAILLCMSVPVAYAPDYRVDLRIIPLLIGTLYGGLWTGVFLSALIIIYRISIGIDLGLYTTVLSIVVSMPVIIYTQRRFMEAKKNRRMLLAVVLLLVYSFAGIASVCLIRGSSLVEALRVHTIHMILNTVFLLFFISLSEAIKDILEKNRRLQSEAKDAEIAFLRSQIKPHFLYNALNSIAALCHDNPQRAEELTLNLSTYLRSAFDFNQLDSLTSIQGELEIVEAYVNIEKARFGDRLRVVFDVDEELNGFIPPLIVQPLVENAIKHGLMNDLRGGTVVLSVHRSGDDRIRFAVEDDGCGMSGSTMDVIRNPHGRRKGIGLWNINQRLQLQFGERLQIESEAGVGTKVSFELPATISMNGEGVQHAASHNRR